MASLKTKTKTEYFENAGPGMSIGDLDEHGGQQQIDFDRFTQVRRTIDPSASNNSLGKSGQAYSKKMSAGTSTSKTPGLYGTKKRSTPFLPES